MEPTGEWDVNHPSRAYFQSNNINFSQWLGVHIEIDKLIRNRFRLDAQPEEVLQHVSDSLCADVKKAVNDGFFEGRQEFTEALTSRFGDAMLKMQQEQWSSLTALMTDTVEGERGRVLEAVQALLNTQSKADRAEILQSMHHIVSADVVSKIDQYSSTIGHFDGDLRLMMEGNRNLTTKMTEARQTMQQEMLEQVERLMKSTTNETLATSLLDLSQKFDRSLLDTGQVKDATNKLLSHQLRFQNAKSNAERGNIAQDEFFTAMDRHFATAEVIRRHAELGGKSADFEIIQTNREPVLIDVKRNTNAKVSRDHVDKFFRDVRTSQKHGVLVSINTSITKRIHFEFEVVENRYVVVFVCNCGNDMGILETALNIVHWVDGGLKRFTSDDTVRLQPDTVKDICHQLQQHIDKIKSLRALHDQSDKVLKDLMNVQNVESLLLNAAPQPTATVPHQQEGFPCAVCQQTYGTVSAFNAHLREAHKRGADHQHVQPASKKARPC